MAFRRKRRKRQHILCLFKVTMSLTTKERHPHRVPPFSLLRTQEPSSVCSVGTYSIAIGPCPIQLVTPSVVPIAVRIETRI